MLADLSAVAGSLREDTFAGTLSRRREEIRQELQQNGRSTVKEGGRVFTITIQSPPELSKPPQR